MLSPWRLLLSRHASYERLEEILRDRVDPWHFDTSRYEQARFAKMLSLVQTVPHERILDVGCAEGHFTQALLTVCPSVTAIDLSAAAVERAQERAPGASFLITKLEDLTIPEQPYDIIVCGEMLYYLEDVAALVPKLRRLGPYLLTSTCYPSALRIHSELGNYKLLQSVFHMSLRECRATSIRLWGL